VRARRVVEILESKNFDKWLVSWMKHAGGRAVERARALASGGSGALADAGPRHVLVAVCDHYEPLWGDADPAKGEERVRFWHERYPRLADGYRDADGRPPRHSFFFPGEQYRPEYLEPLADLARRGYGEVEVHLHHDGDTAASLRAQLDATLQDFARHGHLTRDASGRIRYAFIHGNWCLANARRDGRWCGVDEEIPLLFDNGCYADFTFPAAPNECQPGIVNRIYWPAGDFHTRRGYEDGTLARVGEVKRDRMLMIQGPLAMALRPRGRGVRIENSALTAIDPGSAARARTWVSQGVRVEGRPEWIFVKLHTHGAPDAEGASLLGDGGRALHDALAAYNDGERFVLHYVTAREMYNVAMAAMEGQRGNPNDYRDHVLLPPPAALEGRTAAGGTV
jgi:hypothetical protein